jgi:CRP-like cAMP-binding protein
MDAPGDDILIDPISWLSGLLLLGFILKVAGFVVRDELVLRVLVAGGLACDAAFYGLRSDPILQSVFANGALVSVNVALILLIVVERTTWRMSAEDIALFRQFPTLTPGQFRRLCRAMTRRRLAPGAELTREGAAVDTLLLVHADRILIEKDGSRFPISGPAFVGEIAFLTGNPSSATVTLPEGGDVFGLPIADLKRRMARSPALSNAMVALFGRELARKVADSIPMERAARRPGTAGADRGDDLGQA